MEHKITFTDRVYLENLDDYEYDNVKNVVFPMSAENAQTFATHTFLHPEKNK